MFKKNLTMVICSLPDGQICCYGVVLGWILLPVVVPSTPLHRIETAAWIGCFSPTIGCQIMIETVFDNYSLRSNQQTPLNNFAMASAYIERYYNLCSPTKILIN